MREPAFQRFMRACGFELLRLSHYPETTRRLWCLRELIEQADPLRPHRPAGKSC